MNQTMEESCIMQENENSSDAFRTLHKSDMSGDSLEEESSAATTAVLALVQDKLPSNHTASNPFPYLQGYHPQVHEMKGSDLSTVLVDEEDFQPPKERWAPLGAVSSPEPGTDNSTTPFYYSAGPSLSYNGGYRNMGEGSSSMSSTMHPSASLPKLGCSSGMNLHDTGSFHSGHHPLQTLEELKRMEQEQEQLNNSLLALTSHFAQVQFRLKQIIETDARDKDALLRELEEFTFRGVPDLSQIEGMLHSSPPASTSSSAYKPHKDHCTSGPASEERVVKQRKKQLQLIEKLKHQLQDLESYAYETGELEHPPTMQQLEKQRLVIDELRDKLALNLTDYNHLSTDELKKALEEAVDEIVNPVKNKEKLLEQLKTQVSDLERFIEFLQGDLTAMDSMSPDGVDRFSAMIPQQHREKKGDEALPCQCRCPVHDKRVVAKQKNGDASHLSEQSCVCESRACVSLKSAQTSSSQKASSSKTANSSKQQTAKKEKDKPMPLSSKDTEYTQQRKHTIGLMRRAITLMQLFAASQLGCSLLDEQGRPIVPAHAGGPTPAHERPAEQRRHWGDLRAKLEIAIERVVEKAQVINSEATQRRGHSSTSGGRNTTSRGVSTSSVKATGPGGAACQESVFSDRTGRLLAGEVSEDDAEDEPEVMEEYHSDTEEYMLAESQKEVTVLVRKELCPALAALIQHGLVSDQSVSRSIIPFGCFSGRQNRAAIIEGQEADVKIYHAWDLFIKFYELKHGREYNESAATKLSQSFDLDIVGGKAITVKQQLLSAIGTVIQMHSRFKRSDDAKFKSLICMALNEKKLVPWLRLIVKNPIFLDFYYRPWSYASKTGFNDALHSLNRLSQLHFNLPYDLAVRQFKNIKDAF